MVYAVFEHFQYVEAYRKIVPARLHQKVAGDVDIPLFLFAVHRFRRRAERAGKARLYLAKDDRIPVLCHDVSLSEGRFIVGFEYFIAERFQKFCAPLFPCPAQNFFVNVLR